MFIIKAAEGKEPSESAASDSKATVASGSSPPIVREEDDEPSTSETDIETALIAEGALIAG